MIYLVRVNGNTLHNNPAVLSHYVPGEPPWHPATAFNATRFCLDRGIIRIGWPDTGDLTKSPGEMALAQGYRLDTLPQYVQRYLRSFRDIAVGSLVLMPDKARPGEFYMGNVTGGYHYVHDIPMEPYEHAHRLSVDWDRNDLGHRVYFARDFGIPTQTGFWRRAFADLNAHESWKAVIPALKAARQKK